MNTLLKVKHNVLVFFVSFFAASCCAVASESTVYPAGELQSIQGNNVVTEIPQKNYKPVVQGLIESEYRKNQKPFQSKKAEDTNSVEKNQGALNGRLANSTPEWIESIHFVGYSGSEDNLKASIYYRGTAFNYNINEKLPDGYVLSDIAGGSIKACKKGICKRFYLTSKTAVDSARAEYVERFKITPLY